MPVVAEQHNEKRALSPLAWLLLLALVPVGFVAFTAVRPLTWRRGGTLWRLGGTGVSSKVRSGPYHSDYFEDTGAIIPSREYPRGIRFLGYQPGYWVFRSWHEWGIALGPHGYSIRWGEREPIQMPRD
jgi:hypothetical protein